MSELKFYAHVDENGKKEPLIDHLENTAKTCSVFAKALDLEQTGFILGLLHDVGKYSLVFIERLLKNGEKCDHSSAGAKIAMEHDNTFGYFLAYPIAGHHSGLMDWGSEESGLKARLNKEDIPDYSAYRNDIPKLPQLAHQEIIKKVSQHEAYQDFKASFVIRMLYSCLVDADFLETERFMNKATSAKREVKYNLKPLLDLMMQHIATFDKEKAVISPINQYRKKISKRCLNASTLPTGLFSLTVPTGGGKTLSSMLFALNHAVHNDLKRIIVVIPYTSIIEQNAKVYRDIFGVDQVLEHHSNFSFEIEDKNKEIDIEYSPKALKLLKYASENWDIAITVTTNVQFFESLYANKSSRCRKVHNMANAVIVIDEAQMIPYHFIKPSLLAVDELVTNYHSSVVLSTATQPNFPKHFLTNDIVEIMEDPEALYKAFKRTEIVNLDTVSDDDLLQHAKDKTSYMVIVNLKQHAKNLFCILREYYEINHHKTKVFHLSGAMCPKHRTATLSYIKDRLNNQQPCVVIATNLVECGVDISFPYVYRELAGLDSLIQSAGRCNRNGELKDERGYVYVFESKNYVLSNYVKNTSAVARYILREFKDPLSLDAIKTYFNRLYSIDENKLDIKKIIKECFEYDKRHLHYKFKTAAINFNMIDSNTYNIIIPRDEQVIKWVDAFRYSGSKKILRRLQPYIVHIFNREFNLLNGEHYLEQLLDGLYILRELSRYDDDFGLHHEQAFLEI